ncbi:Gfo/Idh/MocA family protein [Silvibacterium acidisoli]|uniref:Gfo/Idh/MocA family protein n=1 Tax=Acidobacteriaceae bacterium ZG23-2 TaxID=2883246 RepID=UPI00406BE496
MKKIKVAILGTGFMGRVHLEGLRRTANVEVAGIAGRTLEAAQKLASGFDVPKAVTDYHELLADPEIDAVHVCTPNALHYQMSKDALLANKHVLCEKPLATSVEASKEIVDLAAERKLRNAICHNLRFYPMVQQMRRMIEDGDLGDVLAVQGRYFQDWLLFPTDWNWRIEEAAGGELRTMGDIGSHWFDLAEHLTGLRVSSLCCDLQTFHKTRKRPTGSVQTFTQSATPGVDTPVSTEDYGSVIFHMGDRARGTMAASQLAAGRKNGLMIEVCGSKASVAWSQERPDELWVGHRDTANSIYIKDPGLMKPAASLYADLPGGHSEGYDDTFKQIFRRFYASIADPSAPADYPQFADGLRGMKIMHAESESNRTRAWVDVAK